MRADSRRVQARVCRLAS